MRPFSITKALFVLLACFLLQAQGANITSIGYLVDLYCWNLPNRLALDGADLKTNPGAHTAHCMFDIPECKNNGYIMVKIPQGQSQYQLEYALSSSTNKFLQGYLQQQIATVGGGRDDLYLNYTGFVNGAGQMQFYSFQDCPGGNCGAVINVPGNSVVWGVHFIVSSSMILLASLQ